MKPDILLYILVMAGVTYLIRMLPLTLIKKEIKNTYIKSFLYYVPYVTLAVMTFPAIIHATNSVWSGVAAFVVAVFFAYRQKWQTFGKPNTMFEGNLLVVDTKTAKFIT